MKLQILDKRRRAYRDVFDNPNGAIVLEDLALFCRANKPTFEADDPNGRLSAYREGRREVYLRIKEFLGLTEDQITEMLKQQIKDTHNE